MHLALIDPTSLTSLEARALSAAMAVVESVFPPLLAPAQGQADVLEQPALSGQGLHPSSPAALPADVAAGAADAEPGGSADCALAVGAAALPAPPATSPSLPLPPPLLPNLLPRAGAVEVAPADSPEAVAAAAAADAAVEASAQAAVIKTAVAAKAAAAVLHSNMCAAQPSGAGSSGRTVCASNLITKDWVISQTGAEPSVLEKLVRLFFGKFGPIQEGKHWRNDRQPPWPATAARRVS